MSMFQCNGCGGEYDKDWLAATYHYGLIQTGGDGAEQSVSYHRRTFCIACHRVMKSVMLNSDLSEQWEDEDVPDDFLEEHAS